MARILFEDNAVDIGPGTSALQALLDAGHDIPHACRAGTCQSCMLQVTDGTPPRGSQQGLKPTLRAQGYLLSCQCLGSTCPTDTPLVLTRPGHARSQPARILEKDWLTSNILRLRLHTALNYRPGQYLILRRHDGLARPYSLASLASTGEHAELHIRVLEDGQLSRWLADHAGPQETMQVQGPFGDCFYTGQDKHQPLLLAATGTGLAPLYGIVRDALQQGHQGPITLFAGAAKRSGLYLVEELRALAAAHDNLRYCPVVLDAQDNSETDILCGDLNQLLAEQFADMKGYRAYFCGSKTRVTALRRQAFMAGAAMNDIHCDLFVAAV